MARERMLLGVAVAVCLCCGRAAAEELFKVPLGLPPLPIPAENPPTAAKIALGKQLYFDRRLSRDDSQSCADCHDPKKGWSNGEPFAIGVRGVQTGRSVPTTINAAYYPLQFWDGRSVQLEGQALGPIESPAEMNLPIPQLVAKLNKIEGYRKQFQAVFGSDATPEAIARALAAFERTVLSGDSPYDQFRAGDEQALSKEARRGMQIFFGKANCRACHSGPNFSDAAFHNIGIGMDRKKPDLGRFDVSKLPGDRGAFKTPTVREAARTAPYMHDGSLKTLEEVVEHYDRGGTPNPQLDEEMYPLQLTAQEKADLVTFMTEGLSSAAYPDAERPQLPE